MTKTEFTIILELLDVNGTQIPRVLLKTCSASNRNVLDDVSNARQIKQNIPLREINTFYVIRLEASVYFWSLKE